PRRERLRLEIARPWRGLAVGFAKQPQVRRARDPGALIPLHRPALDGFHLLHPGHLHVAAEGEPGDHVLRLAAPDSDQLGAKSDGKAVNLYVHELGRHEVAELVNEDEYSEDDDGR